MERSRRRAQRLVHTFIECRMARRVWTHIFLLQLCSAVGMCSVSLFGEENGLARRCPAKSRSSLSKGRSHLSALSLSY